MKLKLKKEKDLNIHLNQKDKTDQMQFYGYVKMLQN